MLMAKYSPVVKMVLQVLYCRCQGAGAQTAAGRSLASANELQQAEYFSSSPAISIGAECLFEGPSLNLNSVFPAIIQED